MPVLVMIYNGRKSVEQDIGQHTEMVNVSGWNEGGGWEIGYWGRLLTLDLTFSRKGDWESGR